ncbi:cupin domain-containing protein [Synechococcales cyanobacterium C]|uniref:Acireductone dioxygenase n=1 Tax=Petrachloros mirabilis ULC683 TaxID=2781853 RepID=A0A8K2ABV2_9CYAN|nr:cupin domain-containing protein [Petrachloros mirabilis]NCJ05238.1 cupin domain-containing protein [Petrachloros mirabilis ULC683]
MAILRLEGGTVLREGDAIAAQLSPLGITLKHWPVGVDPTLKAYLAQPALDDVAKEKVLSGLESYFTQLQTEGGYQTRDLIVLHPQLENLDTLLAKFSRPHTHDDDEVRYVIDGEGIFGFVYPDGRQLELTVEAEDYINVPAHTEHWFYLTSARRIKAVRYFSGTEGWVPHYTQTEIRLQPVAV